MISKKGNFDYSHLYSYYAHSNCYLQGAIIWCFSLPSITILSK